LNGAQSLVRRINEGYSLFECALEKRTPFWPAWAARQPRKTLNFDRAKRSTTPY
jgi:hypothetical protein